MRPPLRDALLLSAATFALYALTLYPDVPGGDSGELIAAVATRGVIHPPGYPLYALLGGLFAHLPFGTLAWRVNLLSAASDAAAAAFLCLAVTRLARSRWAGVVAAGLFAFAPVVWRYAICAEVFALNNLLCAALLYLGVLYDEHAKRRYALWGAFVAGLGLSNHHTFALVALPVVAWAACRGRADLLRPRVAGRLVAAFGAGLLPYLYLPLEAAGSSPVSWGAADTWTGFFVHVLRREYGTLHLAPEGVASGASAGATLEAWAREVLAQLGIWGVPLPILGAAVSVRAIRERRLAAAAIVALLLSVGVIALLGNLPVSDALHREIVSRFWQQPALLVGVLAGLGVAELEGRFPRLAVLAVTGAIVLAPLRARFEAIDRRGNTLVRSYGAEILRAAPEGALLLTKGDLITNTVRYLQAVEGRRPDVRVVDQELLGYPWTRARVATEHPEIVVPGARYMPGAPDGFVMKELLDANVARATIVICGGVKAGDASADASYGRWPLGLCEEVHSGGSPVNVDDWIRESEAALPRIDFAGQAHPPGSWEDIVWSDTREVRQARAAHLITVAGADPSRRRYIVVAVDILQGIVDGDPAPAPHVFKNLATALGRLGLETPEQRARAAAVWRRYLAVAPKSDAQLPAIEKEVERLERR